MRTLVRSNNNYYNELPSIFDDFNLLGDLYRKGISRPVNSVPSVNVKETETAYELEVAAPGLSKEDFKIDVDGNTLTISAEKETNKEEKQDSYTRKEFSYSSFKRSFNLPERTVETDKITAKYADGVLQLVVPKSEKANTQKRITVA
ncbi:MAG TPA: Hsp20/alpha crystallin family protein [Bacteroidia bacterium]|nr:Hsp20/alpha crystallin family protein [Bacteroidia bacterium]